MNKIKLLYDVARTMRLSIHEGVKELGESLIIATSFTLKSMALPYPPYSVTQI